MQIHLSLRRKGGLLVYGIPLWYRIVSAVIATVLSVASLIAGGFGTAGTIIVIITIIAALYQERWCFDTTKDEFTGRIGLVFAARGPSCRVSDLARLRIDIFAKGKLDQKQLPPDDKMPFGSQARLILDTKNGDSYMLDSVPFKRRARLEQDAQTLSRELAIPLES